MKSIEKNALYNEKNKGSLRTTFAKKEEFKQNLLRLEYEWNIAEFPRELTNLLEKFQNTGKIYVLIDDKLRVSLNTYVNTVIDILKNEPDKDVLSLSTRTARDFESFLIPYFSEFSKECKGGASLFVIIIKYMLSLILRNQLKDEPRDFTEQVEANLTGLTNSLLRITRKKAHITLNEKSNNFIEDTLLKIPISQTFQEKTALDELEHILRTRGLTISLFNQIYIILSKELKNIIERNILQSLFSLKIRSKNELFSNITMSLSRKAAEEIINSLKQQVAKNISNLEEKNSEIVKEINKVFQGFDDSTRILWTSINSEIKTIKEGKDGGTINEVKDRSEVLSSVITRKMWALSGLMGRKTKLDATISELRILKGLSMDELVKHSQKMENASEISSLSNFFFAYIKRFGRTIDRLPPKIIQEVEQILKSSEKLENSQILSDFVERHFIGKKYHPDRLLQRFLKCFEDIILPIYVGNSIMECVSIWPPVVIDEKSANITFLEREARYVGDFLIPKRRFLSLGKTHLPREPISMTEDSDLIGKIVKNFSSLITVLVYDIRGSTFMGLKLGNAKKESEIRRKFGSRMLKIAEKYGAFLVKDTGDGGILFFSDNSRELYGGIYSPGRIGDEWIRTKFRKQELGLREGVDCAKRATLTAKEMILEAQKFVSENINEFSDWFKQEKGRKLFFKGITYAQLPPSFKKIFQIGIGIASGHSEKDIHFSMNAYGDPDVTGNLIRDANLYSKARNPESSVILMDSSSLLNLLLNEEDIEPVSEQKSIKGYSGKEIYSFLLDKTLKQASPRMNQVSYKMKKYGLLLKKIAHRISMTGKDERIIPSLPLAELGLNITDAGQFKDIKGGIIKFLYEVSLEE